MMIARNLDSGLGDQDRTLPILMGLLLFLWLTAAALALTLVGVSFAPEHAGASASAHQLEDLLPADPALWSGFTA